MSANGNSGSTNSVTSTFDPKRTFSCLQPSPRRACLTTKTDHASSFANLSRHRSNLPVVFGAWIFVHMAKTDIFCNRAAAAEAHDDIPRSPDAGETIGDIIIKRYSRREVMRGTLGVAAAAALFGPAALAAGSAKAEAAGRPLRLRGAERPALMRTIMSRLAIVARCCSDGAIRCFPIHPPSIRRRRALPRN